MSLQKLIEEREKLTSEKIPEIMGLEVSPDGTDNQLCIRDEDDDIVESIDFSDEVKELKKFHSQTIHLIIDGVVEMVNDLKTDERKIHDFRDWSAETYEEKMLANAVLDTVISQLQTLKK